MPSQCEASLGYGKPCLTKKGKEQSEVHGLLLLEQDIWDKNSTGARQCPRRTVCLCMDVSNCGCVPRARHSHRVLGGSGERPLDRTSSQDEVQPREPRPHHCPSGHSCAPGPPSITACNLPVSSLVPSVQRTRSALPVDPAEPAPPSAMTHDFPFSRKNKHISFGPPLMRGGEIPHASMASPHGSQAQGWEKDVLAPRLSLLTPAVDGAGVVRSGHLVQKVFTKHLLFTRCGLRTSKDGHTGGFVGVLGWKSGRKMEDVSVVWSRERCALPGELGRSFPNAYRRGYG